MKRFSSETHRFLVGFIFSILCVFASLREIKAQALPKETEAKIRAVLNSPKLKGAHVGLSILDLGTVEDAQSFPAKAPIGKPFRVLFESDADKKFLPASNMKLFTAAIVLELLGKEKTFPTTVWMHGIKPNVMRLSGGGDPSLTTEDLQGLANRVKESKRDAIISEGLAFSAETIDGKFPFGWILDDSLWYYGPEISALAVNRNQLDINVTGGDKTGSPVKVTVGPKDVARVVTVINKVTTGGAELSKQSFEELLKFRFFSGLQGAIFLEVAGQVAPGQQFSEGLAVPIPENFATQLFDDGLNKEVIELAAQQMRGVTLNGKLRFDLNRRNEKGALILSEPSKVIAQHNSPPLKTLFLRFLKNSDNLYAEMLLRNAAYYHDGTGGDKAGPRAHALLKKWLISQGIDTSGLRFEDGSGLSRYNLLTPRATADLLAAINRMKDGDVIWDALPIAGIDGTMKKRLGSTPSLGNVRAKSGTFSIASNLSGYVTTRANPSGVRRRLAVSIYINFPRDTASAQAAQDKIFAILANSRI